MRRLLNLSFVLLIHITGRSEGGFSYQETDKWGGDCQTGDRQSPIDLRLKSASFEKVSKMYFLRYDERTHFEVMNNGHTIKLKLDQPCSYQIVGGGLPDAYTLDHIHFHWKAEHLVDGKRLPMEAHFVHYRRDYKSMEEAADKPEGLAVLGVLFEESSLENKVLRDLLPYFGNQSDTWSTPKYHLAPRSLMPKYRSNFFRYQGSLTTPPCSETVLWTVFRDTLPISKSQIDRLKSIFFSDDSENYRPIQKLNRRSLYIMNYDEKNKNGLSCAEPSKAERTLCMMLALGGLLRPGVLP